MSMSGFPPAPLPEDRRFARLRHPDSPSGAVSVTFLAAAGRPETADHPVVADLARREPERAARVAEGLNRLLDHEETVLAWLAADSSHAALFASDPSAALHQAIPDLPAGFFDGWQPRAAGE
jgi:hypothetical protein